MKFNYKELKYKGNIKNKKENNSKV